MSRWIDADKLNIDFYDEYETEDDEYTYRYVSEHQIDTAPSIDIVRCRECRYWHSGECWGIPYRGDYDTSIDTKADDFCSYGCREEE